MKQTHEEFLKELSIYLQLMTDEEVKQLVLIAEEIRAKRPKQ